MQSSNRDKYLPPIFEKVEKQAEKKAESTVKIPTASLIESHPKPQRIQQNKLTIFGFSLKNSEKVLHEFEKFGKIVNKEFGSNWVVISYEHDSSYAKAVSLNKKIICDEIIGVYRAGLINEGKDKVPESKNFMIRFLNYLFGSSSNQQNL